jgi:hypothetical protein
MQANEPTEPAAPDSTGPYFFLSYARSPDERSLEREIAWIDDLYKQLASRVLVMGGAPFLSGSAWPYSAPEPSGRRCRCPAGQADQLHELPALGG